MTATYLRRGRGMSLRAAAAHRNGVLPATVFAKRYGFRSAQAVREALEPSEWHHTGKYANETYFYRLPDPDDMESLREIQEYMPYLTRRGRRIFVEIARGVIHNNLDSSTVDGLVWTPPETRRRAASRGNSWRLSARLGSPHCPAKIRDALMAAIVEGRLSFRAALQRAQEWDAAYRNRPPRGWMRAL